MGVAFEMGVVSDLLSIMSTETLSPLVSSTGWLGSDPGLSSLGGNPHLNLCLSGGMLHMEARIWSGYYTYTLRILSVI